MYGKKALVTIVCTCMAQFNNVEMTKIMLITIQEIFNDRMREDDKAATVFTNENRYK